MLERARQGALLREGMHVVLAGQPNVGKSSLLNALAGAELAIVTPIPGTTRDNVSQTIQIEGVPLHVIDTAGLRETEDEVERIGIARSWASIADADAVLFLHDLTRRGEPDYEAAECAAIARRSCRSEAGAAACATRRDAWPPAAPCRRGMRLSARTGDGLEALRGAAARARRLAGRARRRVHRTRRATCRRCAGTRHLRSAPALHGRACRRSTCWPRSCAWRTNALGEITGEFSADDLLGEIFSRFCIGK